MIKQLILLIQVLGLFFYQLIFTGDLTVTQKVPESFTQGKEAVIEITINKEDVTGFAKVQQVFPEGFSAEPVETKGATFSFKDNKVKFIWMALPSEKEFTISYKLKPNENITGDFTVAGKFSFISESERQNITIPVSKFSVVADEIIAEVTEVATVDTPAEIVIPETAVEKVEEDLAIVEEVTEQDVEVVEETPEEEIAVVEESVPGIVEVATINKNVIDIITINCVRTIEKIEDRKFKVVVEIDKKGVEGFAKITEEIPEGFTAVEDNSKGGVFSLKGSDAKILWLAVPKEDVYTISYFITANELTTNGSYDIKGHYSYLDKDVTSKYDIDGSGFELNVSELVVVEEEPEVITEAAVEEMAEVIPESIEGETTLVVEEEPIVQDVVVEEAVENEIEEITSTPESEHSVTYKVQVGAGHKTVPATYFKTKFNLKDNVSTLNHEGWIKYLVGSFSEYKIARDKRNKVRNNIKTAFVTAYNSGTRITVQEALMISRQKWYK